MARIMALIWFLIDKCTACGGEIEEWNWKKGFCMNCKKLD